MIYVNDNLIDQVEYLISQSIQGNHVLFDSEMIKDILKRSDPQNMLSTEDAYSVEHHIQALIEQPTLQAKRAYLDGLDRPTLERVIKTYFNIVENSLYENVEVRH